MISVRISESSSAAYQVGRHGVRDPILLCQLHGFDVGADSRFRTHGLLITSQALYQLSYVSSTQSNYITVCALGATLSVNNFLQLLFRTDPTLGLDNVIDVLKPGLVNVRYLNLGHISGMDGGKATLPLLRGDAYS